jgi:hypothetical protein
MSLNIPSHYEPQIQQLAAAQHISTDEAVDRVVKAGLERFVPITMEPPVSNASLFGSVNGPGAHGSKEAVDRYLAELRAEW